MTIQLRYISMTGNTRSFVQHLIEASKTPINAIEIDDTTEIFDESEPYYVLVPTYLTGGTGTGNEVKEEFTCSLFDHIQDGNNQKYLRGIIGSGNRNFNDQFALTAKRYAKHFDVPLLYMYELKGTSEDVQQLLLHINKLQEV